MVIAGILPELIRESPHIFRGFLEFGIAGAAIWFVWALIAGLFDSD
jgi:hypothetical protein